MAKTIRLEGEAGHKATLGMWVAAINERVPVDRADRRRYERLQDAIEGILHREGVGAQQTIRLADGVTELVLEESELELLEARLAAIDNMPPAWSAWTLAAEDAIAEARRTP